MKRRGFLGILGGAAVAGPDVAKGAVAKLPGAMIGDAQLIDYGRAPPTTVGMSLGKASNFDYVAELKRQIAGELTDAEKEDAKRSALLAKRVIKEHDIALLVSVSGSHKLRMHYRMEQKVMRQVTQHTLLSRLFREKEGD